MRGLAVPASTRYHCCSRLCVAALCRAPREPCMALINYSLGMRDECPARRLLAAFLLYGILCLGVDVDRWYMAPKLLVNFKHVVNTGL